MGGRTRRLRILGYPEDGYLMEALGNRSEDIDSEARLPCPARPSPEHLRRTVSPGTRHGERCLRCQGGHVPSPQ